MSFKKLIHIRELVITILIALSLIVVGSFLDNNITHSLSGYMSKPSFFAAIMPGIAVIPPYLVLVFAGSLFFFTCPKTIKWMKYTCMIFGTLCVAAGVFLAIEATNDISEILVKGRNTLTIILSTCIVAGLTVLFILFNFKQSKVKDNQKCFKIAFLIILLIILQLVLANIVKFLASRPRPYVILDNNASVEFVNWWHFEPFKAFKGEDFRSFPSAHTSVSLVMVGVVPLLMQLFDKTKDKPLFSILGFYIGLVWCLLTGLARILALCHFLSDVGMGMLVGTISVVLIILISEKYDSMKSSKINS